MAQAINFKYPSFPEPGLIKNEEATLYLDLLKKALTGSIYEESAWSVLEPRQINGLGSFIRSAILTALNRYGLLLVRTREFDQARREKGDDWPMVGFTMAGHRRLDNVRTCLETAVADRVPGDFIECGAWRGGTSIWARAVLNSCGAGDRTVWVADSFEGMPKPTIAADRSDGDHSWIKYLAVSQETVENNFRRLGLLTDNVKFLRGWFADTLPTAPIEKIAVLRLDGDHYSSTMDTLNALHHKVSKGGFVIVDDYAAWAGCWTAVDEFRAKHGITSEMIRIDDSAVYWRE